MSIESIKKSEEELDTATENMEEQDSENQEADRSQEMTGDLREFLNDNDFKNLMDISILREALVEIIEKGTGSELEKDLMNLMNNLKDTFDEVKSNPTSFSRQFCDIVRGNFEEDAHDLSDDMRQKTREYISRFLFFCAERKPTQKGSRYEEEPDIYSKDMKEQDNESQKEEEENRTIQITRMLKGVNNFLDDQTTEINNIKDIDGLRKIWNNDYFFERAKKSADLGMPVNVTNSLRELYFMATALSQHARKTESRGIPFSEIREKAERDIYDLPEMNKDRARKYVDALIEKVGEIVGEIKND